MKTTKYENIYTALYNQSVQHDNQLGKVDQKWALSLARRWAEINLHRNSIEKFMSGFEDFYYHMFD